MDIKNDVEAGVCAPEPPPGAYRSLRTLFGVGSPYEGHGYLAAFSSRAAPFAHSVAAKLLSPAELAPFADAYARRNIYLTSLKT